MQYIFYSEIFIINKVNEWPTTEEIVFANVVAVRGSTGANNAFVVLAMVTIHMSLSHHLKR